MQLVKRVTREHGLEPLITFTTLGDRVFDSTVPLLFDRSDAQATARAKACWSDLLAQGRELGCFPYRFPIDGMEALRAYAPRSCELVRQLHEAIHPRLRQASTSLRCDNRAGRKADHAGNGGVHAANAGAA